ncbi:alpha/beta hydrolase [Pseudomarimonas salicorniae]|uniref:Alpha/beta hydrolase n=1 Tax=Pseudomarimonas salicorniae TaxID=2933270 RepID=A0ABT0GDM9_9GAMM|nr:alpha/beta hydrolase [Lysobacter sp. CAU 1642]MCK7592659.1 alpha/beta hydrolase [Lysobacter sp. CAU 1642]
MPASADPGPRRVLMVHGAGGGGWEWNRWSGVFKAAGWTVSAPDLQPSPAGLAATTLDDYLCQLAGWIEALRPQALVGASLGGLLCLACPAARALPRVLVNLMPPAPECERMPLREPYPPVIPWASAGRFAGTFEAMEDADAAARLFAFRHWRDESGRVLNAARAGIEIDAPAAACLIVASEADHDVPAEISAALALRLGASLLRLPGGHLSPLLGERAHEPAAHAVAWLNTSRGFRGN